MSVSLNVIKNQDFNANAEEANSITAKECGPFKEITVLCIIVVCTVANLRPGKMVK